MSPRRVLYCEVCEDGTVGGSHQVLFDLATALDPARYVPLVVFYQENRFAEALREQGVRVLVWEAERARERRPFPGGSLPARVGAVLGAIARRARLLRREGVDLVHLNNSPFLGYDDWLPAARLNRVPCVANAVGKPYALPAGGLRRRLVTGYDRILPVSEHVSGELRAGGFDPSALDTVRPGIDVAAFRAAARRDPGELRRELGVEGDEVLALMVGNLRAWKGQDRVVAALRRLDPGVARRLRVAFAGAGRPEDAAFREGLERSLAEAGLGDRVVFLGARRDVPDLVKAADLLLHASVFPEPFGLVVIEGLALGKPVLAARRGGPVEVLEGGAGFLHDPDDPSELAALLAALVGDPERRAGIAGRARARAEELDSRRSAGRIQDLYDELLGGARPRRIRGSDPVGSSPEWGEAPARPN